MCMLPMISVVALQWQKLIGCAAQAKALMDASALEEQKAATKRAEEAASQLLLEEEAAADAVKRARQRSTSKKARQKLRRQVCSRCCRPLSCMAGDSLTARPCDCSMVKTSGHACGVSVTRMQTARL